LPAYVEDDEIIEKLTDLGVRVVSPRRSRYYRGTDIADGTRYMKIKLSHHVKSLPYTMKFRN